MEGTLWFPGFWPTYARYQSVKFSEVYPPFHMFHLKMTLEWEIPNLETFIFRLQPFFLGKGNSSQPKLSPLHLMAEWRRQPEPFTKGSSWQLRTARNGLGVVVLVLVGSVVEGSWGSNFGKRFNGWWFQPIYGKYAREIGSFSQGGVNMKK